MINIIPATVNDAVIIHKLAHEIWYPTYQDVLSKEQIDFMLEKSYSEEALIHSMQDKLEFHLILEDSQPVGFIGLELLDHVLRIDKLYVLPQTQGKGYGKLLIAFAAEKALKKGLKKLELNVNRGNKAYYFYLKQGFEVVETLDIPYYQFILDDYVMRKYLIS